MVERLQHGQALGQGSESIKPDGVEPLENIAPLPMLRAPTMFFDVVLDLFKPGNEALFPSRSSTALTPLSADSKFRKEGVIFFGEARHGQPPSSHAPGRQLPRPSAAPRHLET